MSSTPVGFTPRMEGLDALRGFALMGLFLVHMPELFELYWAHPVTDPVQLAWHNTIFSIFAGKAFALLALCFGVSFFIIMDRSAQKGVDFTGRFIWRLLLLGVIGLLHGLWYRGDVLEILAVMGLFLVPFYRVKSNAFLIVLGVIFLLQPFMIFQIVSGLNGAEWANKPLGFWGATTPEVYLTKGASLWETIRMNVVDGHGFKWLFMWESGRLSQIMGLTLIGLVLGRIGFFSSPEKFVKTRLIGLVVSFVCLCLIVHFGGNLSALVPSTPTMSMPRSLAGSIVGSLGDLSVMFTLMWGFLVLYYTMGHRLLNLLAPAGRMTLSLYLLQSLIFVPVFYGFGMNLHATMSQSTAVLIGIGAFVAQVVFAHIWFKHFLYGPVEWVWRAATYLTLKVPFVRKAD